MPRLRMLCGIFLMASNKRGYMGQFNHGVEDSCDGSDSRSHS